MNLSKNKIKELGSLALKYDFKDVLSLIDNLYSIVQENKTIDVAIVGRFKSGKSSFINSIISRDVLPCGILPVTGVITVVSYAEKDSAEIVFFDGSKKICDINEVVNYVSEERNPGNILKVRLVDLKLKISEDFKKIRFIDTPGLYYSKTHSDATFSLFPSLQLAIVAISFDSPFSENEAEFINILKKHTPKVLILITKTDLISEEDGEKVLEFVRKRLGEFDVMKYSVKDTGLRNKILNDIIEPLYEKMEIVKEEIIGYKTENIRKYLISFLKAAYNTACKKDDEIKKLKKEIYDNIEKINELKKDLQVLKINEFSKNKDKTIKLFLKKQYEISEYCVNTINKKLSEREENLMEISKSYEDILAEVLTEKIYELSETEVPKIKNMGDKIIRKFGDMTNNFIKTFIEESNKVLKTDIPFIPIEQSDIEIKLSKTSVTQAFDVHIELLWFLIPLRIKFIKKIVINHILKGIAFDVEKNLTRAGSSVADILNNEIEKKMNAIIKEAEERISTVKKVLDKTDINLSDIEKDISFLEQIDKTPL